MKAIVCTKYGPPDVLVLTELAKPIPKNNEVLIAIKTTSVTVGDVRIRGFQVPKSFWLPARLALGLFKPRESVLGSIFAGVVESVGKDVRAFKKGDKVFGSNSHHFGAYAEYIAIPDNGCLAMIPTNYSFADAVAIVWGGLASYHFLMKAGTHKDQNVLVYGASGSLGTSAVQIAKYFGANVTAVCSTGNIELVKSLGADQVIDYTKTDFTKESPQYDILFDTVGKTSIPDAVKKLSEFGTYIHTVATPATELRIKWALRNSKKKFVGGTFTPNAELISAIRNLAESGYLEPVIDRTYPLDEIIDAHRYVDQGHKKGNIVITVTSNDEIS